MQMGMAASRRGSEESQISQVFVSDEARHLQPVTACQGLRVLTCWIYYSINLPTIHEQLTSLSSQVGH